jgi:hypothetical protein
MTLSALRDDLIQKIDQDLIANPKNVRDWVSYLADLVQILGGVGATAAEIKDAIETATTILAIRDRLIPNGPALNLGAVNAQTQRVVDAASQFATTNVGAFDGTFTTSGISAVAGSSIQRISLSGIGRSEGSLSLTLTGNGTAPGAATITFYYVFSPDTGATVAQFRRFTVLPTITLTNAPNAIDRFTTDRLVFPAGEMYLWFDRSGLAAGSAINIRARLTNS